MHETGIAWQILETAQHEAHQTGGALSRVGLRLGVMSGVVAEALEFSFDVLKEQAGAPQACLEIERIDLAAECTVCGSTVAPEREVLLLCPACGAAMRITAGEEMELAWIEVEEPETVRPEGARE